MNIENAYQGMLPGAEYRPFDGIVLTDTFQMSEEGDPMDTVFFPRNNDRADRQKGLDIRVIVSNPPWSAGQRSQNDDNAEHVRYPTLDASIRRHLRRTVERCSQASPRCTTRTSARSAGPATA